MSKRADKSRPPRRRPTSVADTRHAPAAARSTSAGPRFAWLTGLAFAIAVVVVIARVLMSETLRPAANVMPGSADAPDSPGPASGLVLDLLAGLCPLLVLARRWLEPGFFRLRLAWSPVLFVLLGIWAVASTFWAADRFSALVSACHLLAAAGLLWSVVQVATTWRHLWLTGALCAALLAALTGHGFWQKLIDRPEMVARFKEDPSVLQKVQNVQPGSFEYNQLVNSIENGELLGFSVSPNTYAAQLTLLSLVVGGVFFACARSRRWWGAGMCVLLLLAAARVLPWTHSRAGILTAALGATMLTVIVLIDANDAADPSRRLLRRRATGLYLLGVGAVLAVGAFIIGYGLASGTLFHDSLNFRWRYWVGSFHLWASHPWLGVGWENFGDHYLGVRIPEATEEIKDPHNYLVRFATELGLIGVLLAAGWTARAWWDVARPVDPADDPRDLASPPTPLSRKAVMLPLTVLAAGVFLNVLCAVDLSALDISTPDGSYATFEVARRVIYLLAMTAAGAAVLLRRSEDSADLTIVQETRPAAALHAGLLVGLGMFFLHCMLDFAMFENGPMFLMALLLGVAVGVRTSPTLAEASATPVRAQGGAARIAFAVCGAAWVLAVVLVVGPVLSAEAAARDADDAFRRSLPASGGPIRREQVVAAARRYESAFRAMPRGHYAEQAAMAWQVAGEPGPARQWLDAAVQADPTDARNRANRAEFLAAMQPPDLGGAVRDLLDAVRLDPMNRLNRLRLAQLLEQTGRPREALAQYLTAFELNERLTKEEKRRFTPHQIRGAAESIARLAFKSIGF